MPHTLPSPDELHHLQAAGAMARLAIGLSDPNPRVGCRLITHEGQVFEGHTQAAGGPHAEVMALRAAHQTGASTQGATAYVTLEPCSHHGRTPPCCDALIAAGVARVWIATLDPNPQVAGRGLARLRAAGVQVRLLPPEHPEAMEARELNIGFFSRMLRGTPWVRLKVAASLDGITALPNGQSQWITGEAARHDGHAWRARSAVVLTGIGTVLADDPRFDVRGHPCPHQPDLAILDSRLRTPPKARLFQPSTGRPRRIFIYHGSHADSTSTLDMETRGATPVACPDGQGQVSLPQVLQDLARREVNELHVEAGQRLNGAWLRSGLVDECLVYLAPCWLGQGRGVSGLGPLDSLQQRLPLHFHAVDRVGHDLRILARPPGRDRFVHLAP